MRQWKMSCPWYWNPHPSDLIKRGLWHKRLYSRTEGRLSDLRIFFFFLIRPTQVRSPSGESFTTWSSWLTSLTLCNTRFYWCLETPMGIFNHVRIHRNYMHHLRPSQMILQRHHIVQKITVLMFSKQYCLSPVTKALGIRKPITSLARCIF